MAQAAVEPKADPVDVKPPAKVEPEIPPKKAEDKAAAKKDDRPTEAERLQMLVSLAAVSRYKGPDFQPTTPEQFILLVQAAAKELGCDKHEDTRHLLTIQPTRQEKDAGGGKTLLFLHFGPHYAQAYVTFFRNGNTGSWEIFAARFGNREVMLIVGLRDVKR